MYMYVLPLAAVGAVSRPPCLSWPAPVPPAGAVSPETQREADRKTESGMTTNVTRESHRMRKTDRNTKRKQRETKNEEGREALWCDTRRLTATMRRTMFDEHTV